MKAVINFMVFESTLKIYKYFDLEENIKSNKNYVQKEVLPSEKHEFWRSIFTSDETDYYQMLLKNFKIDEERIDIIKNLIGVYENMNRGFQIDFKNIYNYLVTYLNALEGNTLQSRIKWTKDKKEFANYVNEQYSPATGVNKKKFTKTLYDQYEFPFEWTPEQCYDFVNHTR